MRGKIFSENIIPLTVFKRKGDDLYALTVDGEGALLFTWTGEKEKAEVWEKRVPNLCMTESSILPHFYFQIYIGEIKSGKWWILSGFDSFERYSKVCFFIEALGEISSWPKTLTRQEAWVRGRAVLQSLICKLSQQMRVAIDSIKPEEYAALGLGSSQAQVVSTERSSSSGSSEDFSSEEGPAQRPFSEPEVTSAGEATDEPAEGPSAAEGEGEAFSDSVESGKEGAHGQTLPWAESSLPSSKKGEVPSVSAGKEGPAALPSLEEMTLYIPPLTKEEWKKVKSFQVNGNSLSVRLEADIKGRPTLYIDKDDLIFFSATLSESGRLQNCCTLSLFNEREAVPLILELEKQVQEWWKKQRGIPEGGEFWEGLWNFYASQDSTATASVSDSEKKAHGGVFATLQQKLPRVPSFLVREARKTFSTLLQGGEGEAGPRWANTKIAAKTAGYLRPWSVQDRRLEDGRPSILVLPDVSGSMSSVVGEVISVSLAIREMGLPGGEIVVMLHSNGYPQEILLPRARKAQQIEWKGTIDSTEYVKEIISTYSVKACIIPADWDGAWLYHSLADFGQADLYWLSPTSGKYPDVKGIKYASECTTAQKALRALKKLIINRR